MPKIQGKPTKSAIVMKLLSRNKGATLLELVKVTAWKEHSVRAYLTGIRKKAILIREQRGDGALAYRLKPRPVEASDADEAAA